jgi:outer membrane receptor protein involved in Fe transport
LGSVNWTLKDFDALLSIRYISSIVLKDPAVVGTNLSVTPNIPIPDLKIPAFTYLDFTVGYNLPAKSRVMAGVRNLTDKQPPILYQNNVTNGNTDVQTYDTIGRQWWLSVSKKF